MGSKMFISGLLFFIFCNIFLYLSGGTSEWYVTIDSLVLTLMGILIPVILASIYLQGFSREIFGILAILSLLFQLTLNVEIITGISGLYISVGFGLAQNIISQFSLTDMLGIFGFFICTSIMIVTFASGIMLTLGSG